MAPAVGTPRAHRLELRRSDGAEIARLSSGEGFGEIALLHAIRRTATVTAATETTVVAINSEAFLTALNASTTVYATATTVAAEFQARDAAR